MGDRNSAARSRKDDHRKKPVSKDTGESGSGTERCSAAKFSANDASQANQPCTKKCHRSWFRNLGKRRTVGRKASRRRAVEIGLPIQRAAVVDPKNVPFVVADERGN